MAKSFGIHKKDMDNFFKYAKSVGYTDYFEL